MDMKTCSIAELVELYSGILKELKNRGILRTKNFIGELGEYLVFEFFGKSPDLPTLNIVPVGTKNINAISQNGERYSIKATTGNVTGVFYGLEDPTSKRQNKQLFEYLIVCKLSDDCSLEGIYQLSWEAFLRHKRWHSRMKAWNVVLTKAMREDSKILFEKGEVQRDNDHTYLVDKQGPVDACDEGNIIQTCVINWNKADKVNHVKIRETIAEQLQTKLGCNLVKHSQSRYVSTDKQTALFVLSASFSDKNNEYWYSINDENIPWMELFPKCYVAFALGSSEQRLLFTLEELKELMTGCLRTKEDESKNKKAHYHFSYAVEGANAYFKKKVPEKEFINVTKYLE